METKILLNEGKDQAAEFERAVNSTIERCNELISAWHSWQDFNQVRILDDFMALVSDPVATLDKLLIGAVDTSITGRAKIDPAGVAPMFGIDYESWQNLVAGRAVKSDCIPCGKIAKIHKGQGVISLQEFQQHQQYMTFNGGNFIVNSQAVNEKQESMKVYITDSEQVELYDYFHNACNTINSLFEKGYIGTDTLIAFQKQIQSRLTYSYGDNRLHVNEPSLMSEILKLK